MRMCFQYRLDFDRIGTIRANLRRRNLIENLRSKMAPRNRRLTVKH